MTDNFQDRINTPVDLKQEVADYEALQRHQTGEELPKPQESAQPDTTVDPSREQDATPEVSGDDDEVEAAGDDVSPRTGDPGKAIKHLRERAKRAEAEARTAREEAARREGELRAWAEWSKQAQQAQHQQDPGDAMPNEVEDPIGAVTYLKNQLAYMQAQQQQAQAVTQVQQTYQMDASRFAAQTPDFRDAYTYAIQSRAKELQLMGATEEQAMHQIRNEELSLAHGAIQSGRSPAEAIYGLAKTRGYQPKAKAEAAEQPSVEQGIKKAQAATSISKGGKSAKTGFISAEEGAQLQGAAFDSWFEKSYKAQAKAGKTPFSVR